MHDHCIWKGYDSHGDGIYGRHVAFTPAPWRVPSNRIPWVLSDTFYIKRNRHPYLSSFNAGAQLRFATTKPYKN